MLNTKKGYTLLELIIVVAVFSILVGALFSGITSSRSSFQDSGYQIDRQQDARRAIDRIAWELKKSSPSWEINSNFYNASINVAGDQLDFYIPVFNETNQITQLKAVRYYMNPTNSSQLLRKEGSSTTVVANNINNVVAQKPFFSTSDNVIIDIKIPVIKNNASFTLTTQANLRNRQVQLDDGVTVGEITE